MCNTKKYPLSLNGDTFNGFKADFDQMLRQLLTEMEKRESEEATISIKMVVGLAKDQERDFEANGYDAMKDVVKPSFKHEISTVMQVKNKKSGSLGGNMKMVWDRDLCQYVMQEIDNGQTSLFNEGQQPEDEDAGGLPVRDARALPPGEVIEADYEVIDEPEAQEGQDDGEERKDSSGGAPAESDSPFEYMRQFIGAEMKVTEAMGNYTVRTAENKVILSSAFNVTDRFYCSAEKLKPHVGHAVICVGYGQDEIVDISIECEDCNEVLFDIEATEQNGEGTSDGYQYEDPGDEPEES